MVIFHSYVKLPEGSLEMPEVVLKDDFAEVGKMKLDGRVTCWVLSWILVACSAPYSHDASVAWFMGDGQAPAVCRFLLIDLCYAVWSAFCQAACEGKCTYWEAFGCVQARHLAQRGEALGEVGWFIVGGVKLRKCRDLAPSFAWPTTPLPPYYGSRFRCWMLRSNWCNLLSVLEKWVLGLPVTTFCAGYFPLFIWAISAPSSSKYPNVRRLHTHCCLHILIIPVLPIPLSLILRPCSWYILILAGWVFQICHPNHPVSMFPWRIVHFCPGKSSFYRWSPCTFQQIPLASGPEWWLAWVVPSTRSWWSPAGRPEFFSVFLGGVCKSESNSSVSHTKELIVRQDKHHQLCSKALVDDTLW